jgi:hypothetical protein
MQIKDLNPNVKNPRKISQKKLENLKKSINKFGDLSGFVYNRRSKNLVSGHQRQKTLPPDSRIKIEHKYDKPTSARTIAEGYVLIDEERFKYREVDADPVWEAEAMIAANKHSGEWDRDLLKLVIIDTPEIDLELAGFEAPELEAMNIEIPQINVPSLEIVEESSEPEDNETDEEYVRNTPETTEQIDTENPNENVVKNNYDNIEEAQKLERRFVLIIDCKDEDHRRGLREKLQALVEESGAKFF